VAGEIRLRETTRVVGFANSGGLVSWIRPARRSRRRRRSVASNGFGSRPLAGCSRSARLLVEPATVRAGETGDVLDPPRRHRDARGGWFRAPERMRCSWRGSCGRRWRACSPAISSLLRRRSSGGSTSCSSSRPVTRPAAAPPARDAESRISKCSEQRGRASNHTSGNRSRASRYSNVQHPLSIAAKSRNLTGRDALSERRTSVRTLRRGRNDEHPVPERLH
jgi:hypothetical protein